MEARGLVLVALSGAGIVGAACVASALISVRRLQLRHRTVWEELGRPYGPYGFKGGSYLRWLSSRGYLKTDDPGLIRACRFQLVGPYVVLVMGLIALAASGAWNTSR